MDKEGGESASSSTSSKGMQALEDRYFELASRGIVLSVPRLAQLAVKLQVSPRPTREALAALRHTWKFIALHSKFNKPAAYMGGAIDKLGNIMVDMGEFKPRLRVANKQRYYILVGVDCLSGKMTCLAFANKSQQSWEKGVTTMIKELYPCVSTIITDRDTAVSGEAFQKRIKKTLGVSWYHLRNRSKAYKAELGIKFLKRRLAIALRANKKGDNNWLQHLQPILEDYNNQCVPGTTIRRSAVNKFNVRQVLEQVYQSKDYESLFTGSVASQFSPALQRQLRFKFRVGQKVLLAKVSNYFTKKSAFAKPSVEGSFGERVFTIQECLLKTDRTKRFYNFVYRLEGVEGLFYPSELKPALFSERASAAAEANANGIANPNTNDDDDKDGGGKSA
jgi:hypothetical protein